MNCQRRFALAVVSLLISLPQLRGGEAIIDCVSPDEARTFVGRGGCILGKVTDVRPMENGNVVVCFGRRYPNHMFMAIIPATLRERFNPHDAFIRFDTKSLLGLRGKTAMVSGWVVEVRGKPSIVLKEAGQISTWTPAQLKRREARLRKSRERAAKQR